MRLAYQKVNQSGIPDEYTELEYLESNGTQYIDTGVTLANNNIGTKITCSFTDIPSAMSPFGAPVYYGLNTRSSGTVVYWNGGGYPVSDRSNIVNKKYVFTLNYKGDLSFTKDGVAYKSDLPAYGFNSGTVYLFAYSPNVQPLYGRIYSCELLSGDTLIRDFIPVKRNSDNVLGLYDIVTSTFYTNAGTGTFTGGTIKQVSKPLFCYTRNIPSEYQELEYIESSGTQYIDTGVKLSSNYTVELDYQLTSNSQYRAGLFGNLVANVGRFGSLLSPSNTYLEYGYGTSNVYWQQGKPDTDRHTIKQVKNQIYFDNKLVYTFSSATFTLSNTAPLGNFDYTNYTPAKAKYYNSKWYDGDTLVRNFIPCKRLSDNAIGMYDTVTQAFFGNAGTGTFIAGNEIKPKLRFIETGV